MRAICIGECMVELREAGQGLYRRGFAGDAYNTAVYLKRSAPDLAVDFLTVTGETGLSLAMRAAWREAGIGEGLAYATAGAEPGLYMIELDAGGDRSFHYWRAASAARAWFSRLAADGGAERLAGADLVFLSAVSLAILPEADRGAALDLITALRGRVGLIAFDTNLRAALWPDLEAARAAIRPMLAVADVVRASRDDVATLFGVSDPQAQLAALGAGGAGEVVLTLDSEGCLVATAEGRTALPAVPTVVKDTSGAGDCFNGAYLAARLAGRSPLDAAQAGLTLAARVVTWPGAVVPAEISHPETR